MNELVKRGFGVYKVFMKNRIASSIMMFVSGIMMFIAAINGKGNDTKSLPLLITSAGVILTIWAVYRFGYLKACFDRISSTEQEQEWKERRRGLIMQAIEALLYVAVAGLGVFLLSNEGFTDKVLNLMAGGFTTLNGVLGAINAYKSREDIDFRWKLLLALTVLELAIGTYFIVASDSIGIVMYIVMGAITTVAGTIEVVSALTTENIQCTLDDGKKIARIIKDGDANDDPHKIIQD